MARQSLLKRGSSDKIVLNGNLDESYNTKLTGTLINKNFVWQHPESCNVSNSSHWQPKSDACLNGDIKKLIVHHVVVIFLLLRTWYQNMSPAVHITRKESGNLTFNLRGVSIPIMKLLQSRCKLWGRCDKTSPLREHFNADCLLFAGCLF